MLKNNQLARLGAGAGIGTSGGTLAFNIKENNWLGEGKSLEFDVQLDDESIVGGLTFSDPNYDFLGNSLYYYLKMNKMINQIKVMKTQF